jgi:hypothetical protein
MGKMGKTSCKTRGQRASLRFDSIGHGFYFRAATKQTLVQTINVLIDRSMLDHWQRRGGVWFSGALHDVVALHSRSKDDKGR